MSFTIYPAIDLRRGQVVRLELGDPDRETVFGNDALATARQWVQAGAEWLHVVNLDGAFGENSRQNWQILKALARIGIPIQFGGGIRTLEDAARALDWGVARVIFGTAAIEEPVIVEEAVQKFGSDQVAVGIDARDGLVRTHGWQNRVQFTPIELGVKMQSMGLKTAIYTDISRDGVFAGVNIPSTLELAQATGLEIITSGGVSSLDDVKKTMQHAREGIVGLITGRALYEGRLDLTAALDLAKGATNNAG